MTDAETARLFYALYSENRIGLRDAFSDYGHPDPDWKGISPLNRAALILAFQSLREATTYDAEQTAALQEAP